LNQVMEMLQKAASQNFWGQIQIDFQNGAITVVRRTETIKVTSSNGKENNTRLYDSRYNR